MTAPTETVSVPANDARDESGASRLAAALEEFQQLCEQGASPDIEEFAHEHPDVAAELVACLGNLALIRDLADSLPRLGAEGDGTQLGVLGDYRLIREIGRGGMGVVYEAEQISLGRRVALKILPFAAVLDPRHLQRFKNEAMAAAHLDHPHIVEVYGVGCERGIHFYAMRYVEGVTLAEVIEARRDGGKSPESRVESRELGVEGRASRVKGQGPDKGPELSVECRKLENANSPAAKRRPKIARGGTPGEECPHTIQSPEGAAENDASTDDSSESISNGSPSPSAETKHALQAALSTVNSAAGKQRFRRIAELGIQAADALDHAHQMGIVHRDVKPSNLMLDERGKLWVTDFGLARSAGDPSMTMTGDLVGTLRYMSPEQALAKRVTLDHRTDIYSLGVTLYELLTLRPAITGDDREATLRQIAFDDPTPPRKIDKSIPAELETIVLKAIAKEADDRYSTAGALADDLAHFCHDLPIRARRPGVVKRAGKWGRRHPLAVVAALLVLLFTSTALAVAAAIIGIFYHRSEEARDLHQRTAYNSQLVHVSNELQRNAKIAKARLEDRELCPPELRDFTWRLYRRLCQRDRITIGPHDDTVFGVAISPDGSLLATAARDGTITLYDATTGQLVSELQQEGDWVKCVAFAPNSETLASGSRDGRVTVWDISSETKRHVLEGHDRMVEAVAFSPNGKTLASASHDQTIRLWNARAGTLEAKLEGHEFGVTSLTFYADGSAIASVGQDHTVRLWDIPSKSAQCIAHLEEPVNAVAVSQSNDLVAFAGDSADLHIWRLSSAKPLFELTGHTREIRCLSFSPDGKLLATAGADKLIILWDTQTGKQRAVLHGHTDSISSIAFAPDGDTLASGGYDHLVKLWDVDGRDLGTPFLGHTDQVFSVAFSGDGRVLASASQDGTVRTWDTKTGIGRVSRGLHTGGLRAVAVSPDGETIATAGQDHVIKIWNSSLEKEIATLSGHQNLVRALAFSPDGKTLASASRDHRVKLWDS